MKTYKPFLIFVSLALVLSTSFFWYAPKASASCGNGYSFCRTVTVQAAQVPSTQTNFTWLVCANATQGNGNACPTVTGLNQTGGGAHVQNSNGYDIIFTSDSGCTTKLNWEMENYVASTGEMEAWVLSSSLSNGTVIYMCYGNATISTFQGGATGTAWNSNYAAVYHLPNGSTLSPNDSTSNANNATNNNSVSASTGQIDGGALFPGTGNENVYLSTPSMNLGTSFTVEGWAYYNSSLDGNYPRIAENNYSNGFFLGMNGAGVSAKFLFIVSGNFGANDATIRTANTWYYVVGTYDGTTATLYVNASSVATSNPGSPSVGSSVIGIGKSVPYGGSEWGGGIDEFRFSTTALSANWITTEYNNESAPSTFEAFGSESTGGTTPPHAQVIQIKSQTIIKNSQQIIN